jgi:hypothetical protein
MCTVTIVPRGHGGFRLVSNRDERHTRADALAPASHRVAGRTITYPIDPASGGTWVGVNDSGIAAAVLNNTPRPPVACAFRARRPSRGSIIPSLLGLHSFDAMLASAQSMDLTWFEPFTLVIARGRHVAVVTNKHGRASVNVLDASVPLLFTTSSLGDDVVDPPRRELFDALVRGGRSTWLRAQFLFHRMHRVDRPDLSVLMARADARTVSRTTVDVNGSTARLTYRRLASAADRDREAA